MAIYHFSAQIIGRSSGRSSVAAAAYRSGEKIRNDRDGTTHDYTQKAGVVYSEILLPENAPKEYKDRAGLWNAVEKSLRRKDAQLAREFNIALPVEFDRQEQIELIREYVQLNFVNRGMCADLTIHDNQDSNPHAHVMVTKNNVSISGFGHRNKDWDDKYLLLEWRKNWADICNSRFEAKGLDERIDHRTLEEQGVDREPTIHVGAVAQAIERTGRTSERAQENRGIKAHNGEIIFETSEKFADYLHELKEGYNILEREIAAIKHERTTINSDIRTLSAKIEDIQEQAETIQSLEERLDSLRAERKGMGFFQSKRDIDRNIERLEYSQRQARNYFRHIFHVEPEQVTAEVTRYEAQITELERRSNFDIAPLIDMQKNVEWEYKNTCLAAELRPDRREIFAHLEELEKARESQSVKSMLNSARIERKLNNNIKEREPKTITRER